MRVDGTAVRALVKSFVASNVSNLWPFVGDEVREALVDQLVMQHIIMANVVDNQSPITPAIIVEFRERVINALARGVLRNGLQCFVLDANRDKVVTP